jgi:hypothetical protein
VRFPGAPASNPFCGGDPDQTTLRRDGESEAGVSRPSNRTGVSRAPADNSDDFLSKASRLADLGPFTLAQAALLSGSAAES